MAYLRIDVDLERRTIGSSELRLVCPAPILRHPAFKHSQAGLPVYQRRLVDSVGVAQLEFGPGSLIGQTKCAIVPMRHGQAICLRSLGIHPHARLPTE